MTAIKAVEAIHQATRPTTSAWDTTIPPLEAAVSFTTIVPNDLLYGDSAAHLGSTMVARYRMFGNGGTGRGVLDRHDEP